MPNWLTLRKSNCKNCYKCIRHCPVKAIRFHNNQAYIMNNECILCGQCFVVCPQNAKLIVNETEKVQKLLQSGDPVWVSLAPSFFANYDGAGLGAMRSALLKLGFTDVEETAVGATMVKNEYERILREEKRDIVISSCCPSVTMLIRKFYPDLIPYLADVLSPMQAHCKDIKRRFPNAKCVFIGPCVSKKEEAERSGGIVDAVLTFEELSAWLAKENIAVEHFSDACTHSRARLFPTASGIIRTLTEAQKSTDYAFVAVDGVENCIKALDDIRSGKIHHCFLEMTSCVGSCIGGPVLEKHHRSPVKDYLEIVSYAGKEDFEVSQPSPEEMKKKFLPIDRHAVLPTEAEITDILRQMGKFTPSQELNCGSCGYNTCREKAIAVYQGKADATMCLPFLKDKAESLSETIVENMPGGLIVLSEKLIVQQLNDAAKQILNVSPETDLRGKPISDVLIPGVFNEVLTTGKGIYNERVYLSAYGRYVEQTIVYAKESRLIICIMRDVTDEEKETREKKESISRQKIEVLDHVVDKQMRIVQEIASLLGETAAETKTALSKLKESIKDE